MKKEELDKQIDRWLKRRETIKPFIDRMVKLNVRREELLQDMKQLQEDYIKALPFKVGDKVIDEAGNGGLCIMPTMEEGCLDYKKKGNED